MNTVFNPMTGELDLITATVPAVVLPHQPVTGAVVDHAAVQWINGAQKWSPAIAVWSSTEYFEPLGFAVNVSGGFADIYVAGILDGFPSFGPFAGYDVYVDPATPGAITFLPVPFTDTYVVMGKAISATAIKIQPYNAADYITSKGGLLTNAGANNGTGDQVLAVGGDGTVLTSRAASTLGLAWQAAVVASAPFTYTTATRTLTIATATDSVAGALSAADHTTYTGYAASIALKAPLASPTFTGTPSLPTGTTGITQAAADSTTKLATTAFVTTADNLKANLASPTFTGTPTLPTGTIGVTQAAGNSTTALATTAFVTTANNLKANIASPVFTGDVNSSTGNVLISTLGKGLQVKTGVNSKIGIAVLVGGTVTVPNTSVTANSLIFLTSQINGGTPGFLRITAKTAATSFVITSSSVTDTSTVAWMIVESIP